MENHVSPPPLNLAPEPDPGGAISRPQPAAVSALRPGRWKKLPLAPEVYVSHATHRMEELEGVRLAPFRRRAIAFVVDFALVGTIFALLVGLTATLGEKIGWLATDEPFDLQFDLKHWYSLGFIAAYFGLATYVGHGQTLGKRWLRIRVVSTFRSQVTFWQSISRALGYATSALELGFGFFRYFIADNRQTTHDRIAGTIVVLVPKRIRPRK